MSAEIPRLLQSLAAKDGAMVYAERMERQTHFRIWIDADGCPGPILRILYRASERKGIPLVLVANRSLSPPESALISTLIVEPSPDRADEEILGQVSYGDLVVTADHLLAYLAVKKGATCIAPRGTLYTLEKVQERLNRRILKKAFPGGAEGRAGFPRHFDQKGRQAFASQLETYFRQLGL